MHDSSVSDGVGDSPSQFIEAILEVEVIRGARPADFLPTMPMVTERRERCESEETPGTPTPLVPGLSPLILNSFASYLGSPLWSFGISTDY